jgi:4-hydroxybenzoate polyprenyltransferase
MEAIKKRRPGEVALGFFLLCHPVPIVFHTIAITAFVLLASWPHFNGAVIALLIGAHTAMQLSIAVFNDYLDRRLDAAHKLEKPIPRGLVAPREALFLGLCLIIVMVLLLLPLNRLALLISLLYLALGQAYNLGLKATPLSGITFALAIPLIPIYAFVGVGRLLPLILWLVPVAAPLSVALNLANSLPDLEGDAAGGVHTLAVVLGVRGTLLVCPLLLLLSILLIGLLAATAMVPVRSWLLVPALLVASLVSAGLFYFLGRDRLQSLRKLYFYLVVTICLLVACGWLIGATI